MDSLTENTIQPFVKETKSGSTTASTPPGPEDQRDEKQVDFGATIMQANVRSFRVVSN